VIRRANRCPHSFIALLGLLAAILASDSIRLKIGAADVKTRRT